jgi:hypothetical protein
MALNLVRNSRVYFTTNVDSSTGVVAATGFTAANTQELQVLDGFTFSQNTNADTVTISEAGGAPVRGQRAFNTSLAPVDFSMSTYIRPFNATTAITAEESVLWNALFSTNDISTANTITLTGVSGVTYSFASGDGTLTIAGASMVTTGLNVGDWVVVGGLTHGTASDAAIVNASGKLVTVTASSITLTLAAPKAGAVTSIGLATATTVKLYKSAWAPVTATSSYVSSGGSNFNQLQKFGMIFVVDNQTYVVDNCAMNQVTVDFGLDAIATAAWTGQGTVLRALSTALVLTSATAKNTTAPFITNKLSTVSMSLVKALGSAAAGTSYAVALTGGSITINNNISYITPANLGVVNLPAVYYTGTRAISGTMNAYLKTGSGVNSTGQLLQDMLAAISASTEPMATISIAIGGSGNGNRVVLDMPAVTFSIPTVDVQQVVSTAINFTAEGYTPSATAADTVFALDETNDIAVRYYAA